MTSVTATLGQRLLDEIKEESLGDILHDLRAQLPSPAENAYYGIKDLDELLAVFLGPSLSANPQTHHAHPGPGSFPLLSGRKKKKKKKKKKEPVIEITSPSSGGGKSQFIYYLIAMSVLPAVFNGHKLDGRGGAVVLLDTDGRVDVQRVYTIIEGVVRHALDGGDMSSTEATDEAIAALIRESMQHIHIFRPHTSSSLLSTLQSLSTYLLNHLRPAGQSRALHGIFIDGLSAFYWTDRLRDEIARTSEIGLPAIDIQQAREQRTSFYLSVLYAEIAAELRRLQGLFGCGIVYTTWGITPRSSSSSSSSFLAFEGGGGGGVRPSTPTFKPHLPAPWNSTFPDLRLVVQRDHVRTYPGNAMVRDWERDAPMRQSVVRKGKFSAWVDTSSITAWDGGDAVLGALRRMPDNGGFPFWVKEEGVFMDDLMDDIN